MRLKSLTFEDKETGWRLEDLRLDPFNLLVGASGVGKTRILQAILKMREISGHPNPGSGVRFEVRFEQEEQSYTWRFDSAAPSLALDARPAQWAERESTPIIEEWLSADGEDEAILERTQERFLFKTKALPMLSHSTSALRLLEEPVIVGLRNAFNECFVNSSQLGGSGVVYISRPLLDQLSSMDSLHQQAHVDPIIQAFALQERQPDRFNEFKQRFIDIFPTVEDVAVEFQGADNSRSGISRLAFKLKERGVQSWVRASAISSGMSRTLQHLVSIMLAPQGTVVLIDEFENSLGVNCMGPLTDLILSRANELQFVITSHHPYIINNIPKEHWKIVRRKGSTVRVTPASEIAALRSQSSQDDFIRLLNSPEFEEGLG